MSAAGESGYQVLARKYRPMSFADLVGQDAMVRTLKSMRKRNGDSFGSGPGSDSEGVCGSTAFYLRSVLRLRRRGG